MLALTRPTLAEQLTTRANAPSDASSLNPARHMQAIITKYLPATDTKGSRIKAQCARGSLTIGWPHEYEEERAHRYAAVALTEKFVREDAVKYDSNAATNPWGKPLVTGCLPSGNYCHVFTS